MNAHRKRMLIYTAKRILIVPISVFVLGSISFVLVFFIPGKPAFTILGDLATPEQVDRINHALGLDKPLGERYLDYWNRLLHGDLGKSFFTSDSITSDIAKYLPNTIELVILALLVAVLIGTVIGTLGSYFARRWPDKLTSGVSSLLQSIPDFFLALVGIYFFFFLLGWAPSPVGRLDAESDGAARHTWLIFGSLFSGDWDTLGSALAQAVLPVMALGLAYAAYFAKTTRSNLGKALSTPQVEFARACGLSEVRVVYYAFLAARTSIVTYIAILFGSLLGGAAIVERIFNWRGMGQWALEGVLKVDVPTIQGFVIVAGLMSLVVFLALDLLVLVLDPRVSYV